MKEPVLVLDASEDRQPVAEPVAPPRVDDYFAWAYRQADHLRTGCFHLLDMPNVIDEIEAVARGAVASFPSNLKITLTHMLKWEHQPSKRSRSWKNSIGEHRDRIEEDLTDSPSMVSKRDELVRDAYGLARRKASRETRLPLTTFPETCPYSWTQIMTAPYEMDRD